jgi:surfeit locus 1 family protein
VPRRVLVFLGIAALAALVCVRLGVWQLSRLAERRARNRAVAARFTAPPAAYRALPADTAARHYRRVLIAGRPDYAREFVLANRTRDGSPGVHIVTPVRVAPAAGGPPGDTLLLVNRGWIYSGDGTRIDLARWREGDSIAVTGYVELPSRRSGPARLGDAQARAERGYPAYRFLDAAVVAGDVGAPVTRDYVVAEAPPGEAEPPQDRPVRVPPPALDEGPHWSYAVQWFSFAAVALAGGAAFARAQARGRRGDNGVPARAMAPGSDPL